MLLDQKRSGLSELLNECFDRPLAKRNLIADRIVEIEKFRIHSLRDPFLHNIIVRVSQIHIDRFLTDRQIGGEHNDLEFDQLILLEDRLLDHYQNG